MSYCKRGSTAQERLDFRTLKGSPTQCWEWQGACDTKGYGILGWRGRVVKAHRLVYATKNGSISAGLVVMHSCDNRRCVNPAHLSLGTTGDNNADMVKKGRLRHGDRRGERNSRPKLNTQQVLAIRADTRPSSVVGGAFGVTSATVRMIKTRQRWQHI